jgi:CheY-like chemotaxis protein
MSTSHKHDNIRVLIADDDEHILDAYREAFSEPESTQEIRALDALAAELFDPDAEIENEPNFDVVACSQGEDAIALARGAAEHGQPFDVVILDVRMPPGIDGVEAGREIRKLDPNVEIVFVTGFSDMPLEELQRRVPPPLKLHYYHKPLSFTQLAHDVASMVRTN